MIFMAVLASRISAAVTTNSHLQRVHRADAGTLRFHLNTSNVGIAISCISLHRNIQESSL